MEAAIKEPEVNVELAGQLGILPEEFDRISELLGRTPNYTELSMFSVMWSEHCSYKNSINLLKTLPKDGPHILAKAGEENAGLVDIGDGLACAFKIESHNHPSAIEPYQGAATGVGGIHRDIFTMGARPIAALNSLRFGNISHEKTKWLVRGVVKGIGDYGNSFGIPTVGGEVYFDESYHVNPLVNAMSVGIVKDGKTISATAHGVGNPVYIVGSATGKDGIHGATFASGDITEDSAEDLPAVQVGDPFQEKLLLEATLEAIDAGVVVGMQDMGAAGITCSTSEMCEKGEHGMKIYLDKVPTRQKNMKPFEILLSESQERMLVVVEKGKESEIERIFDKWDLNCAIIGEVVEEEVLEYYMHGELVARIAPKNLALGGDTPAYTRETKEPEYVKKIEQYSIHNITEPQDLKSVAEFLAKHPNIASKQWIYNQYDSMVQINNTSTNQPADAATVRVLNTNKALAVTVDCNPYFVYANPVQGTAIAVSEAARNIVCSGGEPSAITNCLNFGNPYNPEVYWQFDGAIKGMKMACEKLNTPVTGGNVSFYNQSSDEGPVMPNPAIGMVGVLDDIANKMTLDFKSEGDEIFLIGQNRNDISSSQYLIHYQKERYSPTPYFDMEEEYAVQRAVADLIKERLVESAHDVSEGGLFITLLESAMASNLGFSLDAELDIRKDAFLFGESQSRVVVSIAKDKATQFKLKLENVGVNFKKIGSVSSDINVWGENWGNVTDWSKNYDASIADHMSK